MITSLEELLKLVNFYHKVAVRTSIVLGLIILSVGSYLYGYRSGYKQALVEIIEQLSQKQEEAAPSRGSLNNRQLGRMWVPEA